MRSAQLLIALLAIEHQSTEHSWQQKPCMRQSILIPRDGSLLLLLAVFERPLLKERWPALAWLP